MVFRRRFPIRRRKKVKGRPLGPRQKKDVKTIIKRVMPDPELKAISINLTPIANIDNGAGDFHHLIGPTSGPGLNWSVGSLSNQRIGTEIYVKKVAVRWSDYIPNGMFGAAYRFVAFIDHEGTNTTTMFGTNEGFFNGQSLAGYSALSSYNLDTVSNKITPRHKGQRFTVLADRVYTNHTSSSNAAAGDSHMFKRVFEHTFPNKGMKCLLNPSDGPLGTEICQANQIYLWWCQVGTTGGVPPAMAININEIRSCVYYYDA